MSLPGGSAAVTMNMSVQAAQSIIEKDFDLLQMVLDLMQSVENPKGQKEELTRKESKLFVLVLLENRLYEFEFPLAMVAAFKNKMTQCKEVLSKLPGLEYSPEEQDLIYEKALNELERKKGALERLKQLGILSPTLNIKQEPQ